MADTFDPTASNAITFSLAWLQGTLLGIIATTLAVIAIALIGFLMLTGRINARAPRVVFGCSIIFGASTIAQGIMAAGSGVLGRYPAQPLKACFGSSPAKLI